MAESAHSHVDRPSLVKGSEAPIVEIVGGGPDDLSCSSCGSVLVVGYRRHCLVGIGLECRCGHVTLTPSLADGETFHSKVVTLGAQGRYLIGGTVRQHLGTTLTCDQELTADAQRTVPGPAINSSLDLSAGGLEAMATEVALLSGGRFDRFMRGAERARATGQRYFRKNSLAWAISHLSAPLADGTLRVDEDTAVAIGLIDTFRHVVSRWRHVQGFPEVARELCNSFHHTLFLLVAASYLCDHGNKVLFNAASQPGRTADLYVPVSGTERLYLEVKGPAALEWPSRPEGSHRLKPIVRDCLRKARKQIGRSKPGVLIIASSCIAPGFFEDIEKAVRTILRRHGKDHAGVAGVAVAGLNQLNLQANSQSQLRFWALYRVAIEKNPHYFRDNPVVTSRPQRS